jgi:hypothetical protein
MDRISMVATPEKHIAPAVVAEGGVCKSLKTLKAKMGP